jgi:hypothetical protein
MKSIRSTALVIALGAAAAGAAHAAENPFVGKWHWNATQSTLPPGATAPKDVVSDISQADGGAVSWTVTVVTPDDQQHVMTFKAGAEPQPMGKDTTASARVNSDTLETTFKGNAGQSDTLTCTVSANDKQMTCNGVLSDGKGHSVKYVDVYDRI